ncbi:MAG: hypothetical protein ACLQAT_24080 [Candidatus Binataceae bacterium]
MRSRIDFRCEWLIAPQDDGDAVVAPDGDAGRCHSFVGERICIEIPDVAGTYTGAIDDSVGGQGTLNLTVEQNGKHITGVWSTTYPEPGYEGLSGTLTGTVSTTDIRATLKSTIRRCHYLAIATIASTSFQGTFTGIHCPEDDSGTFVINKEQ